MSDLSPADWQAVFLSFKVAGIALLFALPLALIVAYVLARWSFRGKVFLDGLVHLPLVLPPVVTGYVLLLLFGRAGILGRFFEHTFGLVFAFRWTGAALAAGIMAFPLMVRPMRIAIEGVDRKLEEAASTLGARQVVTLAVVTLPLALPGIIAAALLGFAKAMGEFGATITFVSNIPGETRTLALDLYTLTQTPDGDGAAFSLIIIAVVIAFGAVIASEIITRRLAKRIGGN
ncbi:MAG: molybdate ABC transporter permease subunit [Stappiaceae bacterium]